MKYTNRTDALLVLADGTVYKGKAVGKIGTTTGEVCFNTGMTGYQEVFTDPSYFGQVLVMTEAHIGNYGTYKGDLESKSIKISGLVVRNFNELYSRHMADASIQEYLENENVVAISDVDTRAVVSHVRDKGAMNCIISSEILDENKLKEMLKDVPSMAGLELASKVSTETAYELGQDNDGPRVAVLDLGVKQNILDCMTERGCVLKVFPAKTDFSEIESWGADGYFLSNGPGDPASMEYATETAKKMMNSNLPMFGICLGHQIIAQANGMTTYKMHNGHRGLNHPVLNIETGLGEITSQNHGFTVSDETMGDDVEITHKNLNDDTVEGIKIKSKPIFSVQYHPESSPGPHDSRYLFDNFVAMMVGINKTARVEEL